MSDTVPLWYSPLGGAPTYGTFRVADLPSLEEPAFDGSLSWLLSPPSVQPPNRSRWARVRELLWSPDDEHPKVYEDTLEHQISAEQMKAVSEEVARRGFVLPPAFEKFVSAREFYWRVPTCTACYLEFSPGLLGAQDERCAFLRFLNDQQSVVLWYLYLRPDGSHCICAGVPREDGDLDDGENGLVRTTGCAPSFEAFLYRFWFENKLWYARLREMRGGRHLTEQQNAYLRALSEARG